MSGKNWNLQARLNRQEVANQQNQGVSKVVQAWNGNSVGTGFAQKYQMTDIPVSLLHAYPEQSNFSMDEDEMETLVASVKASGILQPIIVRVHPSIAGAFEIIAGHRRCEAAKRCGMEKAPCQVCPGMTDEEARTVFYATNMGQRQELLPSERAAGYNALAQALRLDGNAVRDVAKVGNESKTTVYLYMRLSKLNKTLIQMVDNKEAALTVKAGSALADLSPTGQENLVTVLQSHESTGFGEKTAKELVALPRHDVDSIERFLYPKREKKPKAADEAEGKEIKSLKLEMKRFGEYLSECSTKEEMLDYIEKALILASAEEGF